MADLMNKPKNKTTKSVLRSNLPRKQRKQFKVKKNKNKKIDSMQGKLQITDSLASYLDAYLNPIEHTAPVRLPDGAANESLCVIDTLSLANSSLTLTSATADAVGVFISLSYGGVDEYSAIPNTYGYQFIVAPVNSSGNFILNGSNFMGTFDGDNAVNIEAILKSMRLVAGGIKVLPLIEFNTGATSQFVTKYYTGCCTANDIRRVLTGNIRVDAMAKQAPEYQEFINKEGVCLRYDPFQMKFLQNFYALDDLNDVDVFDTSPVFFPFVYVTFAQVITPVAGAYTIPLLLTAKLWFEGIVKRPSAIAMARTDLDLLTDIITKYIHAHPDEYSCVSAGHSFKTYYQLAGSILLKLHKLLQFSYGVYGAASVFL